MQIVDHFKYAHLPAHLQEISKPFGELAQQIAERPRSDQQRMSLEHLLIAKDAAVRARIEEIANQRSPKLGAENLREGNML